MRIALTLPVALAVLVTAGPALAVSCKDDISTVERRLNSAGAEQVTGKEPPGGVTSSNSPKALDKPPAGAPSDPSTKPTKAGVEEARTLLAKAKEQGTKHTAEEAAPLAVVVTPALGATQDAVLIRDDGSVPVITHEGH